jgi:predicted nucleic acid-binding protein
MSERLEKLPDWFTVRILIDSKKSGMIRNVEEILKIMQENGYWIHDDIIEYALKVAGEK